MKNLVVLSLILAISAGPALPKPGIEHTPPPGNWAKVESLAPGSKILVSLKLGNRINGEFLSLDSQAIRLKAGDQEKIFPKSDVSEVRLIGVKRSKAKYIAAGTAIGAFGGMLLAVASYYKMGVHTNGAGGIFAGVTAAGAAAGYG